MNMSIPFPTDKEASIVFDALRVEVEPARLVYTDCRSIRRAFKQMGDLIMLVFGFRSFFCFLIEHLSF